MAGERSGWDLVQMFLFCGILIAIAYNAQDDDAGALRATGSSSRLAAVVYVSDASSNRWPVARAAADWSRRTDVTLRYARCRTNHPCIRITDSSYPLKGEGASAYATTTRSTSSSGASRVTIRLNNTPALSPGRRRSVVCREIGRALGLNYTTGTDSCMSRDSGSPMRPTRTDVAAVNRLY